MSLETTFLLLFFISASFFLLSFLLSGFGDIEADASDADAASVSAFSLKTIMMFLTGFGAVGYISRHFGSPGWLALLFGAAVGFLAAWGIYRLLWFLAKNSARKNWRIDDAWGHDAEVIVRIEPDSLGKILVTVHGEVVNYPAKSHDRAFLPQGTKVTIVDIDRERGVATVADSRGPLLTQLAEGVK